MGVPPINDREKFKQETFFFWSKTLRGQQSEVPRWQMCTNLAAQSLPDLVGRYYVQRAFSANSKEVSLEMIQEVKAVKPNPISLS
jgi:putative endopeptidase